MSENMTPALIAADNEPYDLMFERSGKDQWTSRNNNYVIRRMDARLYGIYIQGKLMHTEPSKPRAALWAGRDQARILGL